MERTVAKTKLLPEGGGMKKVAETEDDLVVQVPLVAGSNPIRVEP